jgi:hypothetical protein
MDLDYNTRLAAIQRNEKLAQIMQQQAFQPIETQSYQGIQAPISPLSGLANVLQAYMGAKGTGDEERIKLNQEAKAEAQQMLSSLNPTASPGRAAVMAMPEVQARPATSFTPMGSDFEDNPNLQTAPSGNVETPAVAYQPAVAAQAAIPPTSGAPLSPEQKNQRLVQMLMSGNPYAAPVAKLEYERLGKQESGPLAEYRLAQQQGYTGTIDQYKTQQAQAGRSITNVSMPSSMAPMFVRDKITGEKLYVQANTRGTMDLSRYEPIEKPTDLRTQLADAGIFPNNPDGTPNPKYVEYAEAALRKNYSMTTPAGSVTTGPGEKPPGFVPKTDVGETINLGNRDAQGNLIITATPGSTDVASARAGQVASAEAGGKVSGTSQAQATIDLPKVIDNADTAVKHVQELLSHPAFKSSVGMGVPGMKYVPGSAQADFRSRMDQIQGGAFLTAIDTLKGTGAITEVEGTKATAAKNRMATATSEKAFNDAAKDFLDIMEQGVKQTYSRAGKAYVPLQRGPAPKIINFGDLPK